MNKTQLAKILYFSFGFITLSSVLIYYFYLDKSQRTKIYLSQQVHRLHAEFQATKNTYIKLSHFVYDELVHNSTFLHALLSQDSTTVQEILAHHYKILQKYAIHYVTLYTPHGDILAAFHTIKSEKKRNKKRQMFFSTKKNTELIIRFKRPILYKNNLVATLETAISYNTLKLALQKLFSAYYEYIVSENTIDKNLLNLGNHLFIQSDIHPRFFYEKTAYQNESTQKKLLIHAINSKIKKTIASQLTKGTNFATYTNIDGTYYVVTFLAIKTDEALAYLISYHPDANIAIFDTIFWQNVILALMILSVVLAFFYYFLETKDRLERMAITDKLTGLYNRHKFYQIALQELQRAQRHKRPLSLIIFDIDHFKKINDTYGHDVGDIVLRNVASLVKKHIRKYDKAFRWGGEEFIIIAPETTPKDAVKLAEKIRTLIASYPFEQVGNVTISLGVAGTDNAEEIATIDTLIKRADSALYLSKKEGRNRSTLAL